MAPCGHHERVREEAWGCGDTSAPPVAVTHCTEVRKGHQKATTHEGSGVPVSHLGCPPPAQVAPSGCPVGNATGRGPLPGWGGHQTSGLALCPRSVAVAGNVLRCPHGGGDAAAAKGWHRALCSRVPAQGAAGGGQRLSWHGGGEPEAALWRCHRALCRQRHGQVAPSHGHGSLPVLPACSPWGTGVGGCLRWADLGAAPPWWWGSPWGPALDCCPFGSLAVPEWGWDVDWYPAGSRNRLPVCQGEGS